MRKKIILLGLWIGSLVLISFYGGKISYGIFFALTLIPVVSLIYLVISVATFRIYQEIGSRTVVAGKRTDYYFKIKNTAPFVYSGIRVELFSDFFTVDDVPNNIEYELLPNEEIRFNTKLICKYRGQYDVGVSRVIFTDVFRIFRWKYKLMSTVCAIVNPNYVELNSLASVNRILALQANAQKKGYEFPDAIVRDYVPGDSIRHIHWKSTAKTGELKVRNFYDEDTKKIKLFFETKRFSSDSAVFLPMEDRLLSVMLSVLAFFAYHGIAIDVTYDEFTRHSVTEIVDPKSFESFYTEICELSFHSAIDIEHSREAFLEECFTISPQIVFFVTQDLSPELIAKTEQLMTMGSFIVIYYISDDVESIPSNAVNNERRQIIQVRSTDDLEEVLG